MSSPARDLPVTLRVSAAGYVFTARLEHAAAPTTSAAFAALLPFRQKLIHVRWSGEACWIPLGDLDLGIGPENQTSYPAPGQVLLYPGGISETEILVPYGGTRFSSIVGQLAGNHFLTLDAAPEELRGLGERCLWRGAQDIIFEAADQRGSPSA